MALFPGLVAFLLTTLLRREIEVLRTRVGVSGRLALLVRIVREITVLRVLLLLVAWLLTLGSAISPTLASSTRTTPLMFYILVIIFLNFLRLNSLRQLNDFGVYIVHHPWVMILHKHALSNGSISAVRMCNEINIRDPITRLLVLDQGVQATDS